MHKKSMGFSFSSQPLTSDASSSSGSFKGNKKPATEAAAEPKKPNRQTNMMLQMDDFLSLARDPAPVVKKPVVVETKTKIVKEFKLEPAQQQPSGSESKGTDTESVTGDSDVSDKKKHDRNAPLKPKAKKEDPKKLARIEAIKKKKEEADAAAKKKEDEELAAKAEKLRLEEEAKAAEEAAIKARELAEANKEPRLQEIVQEYLACAPISCKYRGRNSELMNIVHDLVGLNRSVDDYPSGLGKEDKKYLKLEEFLTRCLVKFDNIERSSEVLIKTRKQLIHFTQRLLDKLETKATDTSAPAAAAAVAKPTPTEPAKKKKNKNKKQQSVESGENTTETDKPEEEPTVTGEPEATVKDKPVEEATSEVVKAEAVVAVDDVKIEANPTNTQSIEEIMKKKGKSKKKKNK